MSGAMAPPPACGADAGEGVSERLVRPLDRRRWLALAGASLLGGCARQAPLRLGLLNEVLGTDANFGEDARNGVVLAVDWCNAAGGVGGRPLELLVRSFEPGQAPAVLRGLHADGVQAMVGPFGTQLAQELLPVAAELDLLLLSPTAMGDALVGQDDQLLRLNLSNSASAQASVAMLLQAGSRRVALARDHRYRAYTHAWSAAFRAAFEAAAGTVVETVDYGQEASPAFDAVVARMLLGRPDTLVFVSSGPDAARLAQQARKRGAGWRLAAAPWAATHALVELGGQAVEGLLVALGYNPQDTAPRYLVFHQAFGERFGSAPGYGATCGYDAVLVLAQAMARAQPGESPKQVLLRHGPYQGLQQSIVFDRFGDAGRAAHAAVVQGGRFVLR